MRISEKFVLLGWGSLVGGIVSPIVTTDIMGFRRVIEAVTVGAKFDWGSFLGGSIAGAAAFGLFALQRHVDRKEKKERQLGLLNLFCVRALANLENVLKGGVTKQDNGVTFNWGVVAVAAALNEDANDWPDFDPEHRRDVMKEVIEFVRFIDNHLARLWVQLNTIELDRNVPSTVVERYGDIVVLEEKIRRVLATVAMDASPDRWPSMQDEVIQTVLRLPIDLIEGLRKLEAKFRDLKAICE
ncbi:hypothetical protein [Thalassospira marina]|uniref:Uncharacterized protein n=1 Tax=Thalassospira marina TaxID=2048283 RepID=A0A2N3KX60_9PROT|nr:hypothetical protein [Thalassospira marina]PKR55073.1 hypothetical protein COO20_06710 [Thalassospira marina]